MFIGYPYSHEDLERLNKEIQRNEEEHPEQLQFLNAIGALLNVIIFGGFWLTWIAFMIYWLFFCP